MSSGQRQPGVCARRSSAFALFVFTSLLVVVGAPSLADDSVGSTTPPLPSSVVRGALRAVGEVLSPDAAADVGLGAGSFGGTSAVGIDPVSMFIDLDVLAGTNTAEELRAAARSFEISQERMVARAKKAGRGETGALPWATMTAVEELRGSLAAGAEDRVATAVRRLVRLVVRGSLPASVTRVRSSATSSALPLGLAGWQQLELSAAAERLGFELRVHPGRAELVEDPEAAVLGHLLASHDLAMGLAFGSREGGLPMGEHAIVLLRGRLEQAVILSAGLIEWARREAARSVRSIASDSGAAVEAASGDAANAGPAERGSDDAARVASRGSKVFHRADCPHARRISPANLRTFPSRSVAEDKGLRPCKTCAP